MTTPASLDAVIHGHRGRLFLNHQESFDLRAFLDGSTFTAAMLARWRRTARRRAAELAARSIPYVFYIVPDAPSVYPEDLPPGITPASMPAGARLAAALQDIPNLTVVYPLQELLEAKGGLPTYRKTDTHWSGYGAFVAYAALCRRIGTLVPINPLGPSDIGFTMKREFGDLGSLVTPECAGSNPAIGIEGRTFERGPLLPGPFRTNSQLFHAPAAAPARCLILRDSFMTEQAPLMAVTFSTTEMLGTTSRLFLEHVGASRPDIVITEICERRLTEWENDHQLLGYDEMFGPDWTSDIGRIALAAEMALGHGQTDAAGAAAARLLEHEPDLAHGHAFIAARACLASGDLATADRLIDRAMAAEPGRAAYICIAAQIRFGLGDGIQALALAETARGIAPWNGYVHELLGYLLLAAGRPVQARAVFDAAGQRIDDHPSLCLLASMAAEQCGDAAAAIGHMQDGIDLWPDNRQYHDRLAVLKGQPLPDEPPGALLPAIRSAA